MGEIDRLIYKLNFKLKRMEKNDDLELGEFPHVEQGFYGKELRRLVVHDLAGPVSNINCSEELMLALIERIEQSGSEDRARVIFDLRRLIHTIGNSARAINDLSGILRLEDMTPEDLKKYKEEFSPLEKIRGAIQAYEHQMISQRQLGVEFEYPSAFLDVAFDSNVSVFSTVISNLLGNAMKYSVRGSVIKVLAEVDSSEFYVEIENMVNKPIDTNVLKRLFERGYRIKGEVECEGSRNEGLGLYLTQRGVRHAYKGSIDISSGNSFQITQKRTKGFRKECYGLVPHNDNVPALPSFNAKVRLPLENLIIED